MTDNTRSGLSTAAPLVAPSPTPSLTLVQMRADIAALLHEDPQEIQLDDNLMDLGLDSLRVMNLLERWARQGVQLDFTRVAEHVTLAGWWQLARAAQGK